MSTLPPEQPGDQPEQPQQPVQFDPPAAPSAPETPDTSVAPEAPEAIAVPAASEVPEVPEAPAAPAAPEAPQYAAPPAGAYQQPPAGGYQPPAAPVTGAADPAAGTITLNYWLSVFFAWIPALIFWIIEKDKGNHRATAFHVANLNFSLLRTAVGIGISVLGFIPYIGWLFSVVLWLGSIVLFVFHIMAAIKAPENYRNNGATDPFIFNIPLIK